MEQYPDVYFEVEGKLIKGNRAVLAMRSHYFRSMFTRFREKDTDCVPLNDLQLLFFTPVVQ